MISKICSGLFVKGGPVAVPWYLNSALIGHLQKQKVGELFDVVAVIDTIVPKRVAEAPKFLYNVGHAAIASLNSRMISSNWLSNTRLARPQPPYCVKMGITSKSSLSIDKLAIMCSRIRSSH